MKNINTITAEQYARAFRAIPRQIGHELLEAALDIPDYTRQDLAEAVGLKSGRAVNLHFGKFAHEVADFVGITEAPIFNGRPYWMLVLEYEPCLLGSNGHTAYCLRESVVEALRGNTGVDDVLASHANT
jgi:hypothetical protein